MSQELEALRTRALEQIARVEAQSVRLGSPCGNGEMLWHRWGDGGKPPLVLFHGGYGSWLHWFRNVLTLSEHYTVFAADLPGLGESAPPPEPRDPHAMGKVIAEGLETVLPSGSFDLVGFSYGAVMAGHAASLLGERVRSFTLVGAGGLGLKRGDMQDLVTWRPDMSPEKLAELHRRNLEILMVAHPETVDDVALYMQMTNTMRAVVKSRYISRTASLAQVLPSVKAKLAGIWGELDGTTHPYTQERCDLLRSIQPDAPFEVVPNSGHWVQYETPAAFDTTLLGILRGHG